MARRTGPAVALHGLDIDADAGRTLWLLEVERPALVLGSTQPDTVDRGLADRWGVDIVRRRSGGGAVLVEPGGALWVDVVVPRGDPLWSDDVTTAGLWLGEAWVDALDGTEGEAVVHRGGLRATAWSRAVCFAGLGPAEVTIDGRKVVGVAARRTRHWARFQTVVLARWDPAPLVALLGLPATAVADLAPAAAGLPLDGLTDALVAAIDRR